jgi:hypothetical protein
LQNKFTQTVVGLQVAPEAGRPMAENTPGVDKFKLSALRLAIDFHIITIQFIHSNELA